MFKHIKKALGLAERIQEDIKRRLKLAFKAVKRTFRELKLSFQRRLLMPRVITALVLPIVALPLLFPQLVLAQAPVSEFVEESVLKPAARAMALPAEYEILRQGRVYVTAYSSTPDQTDSSPFITANGMYVYDGLIATNFLPFGSKVRFPAYFGEKIFTVNDRMNPRYNYRLDIWMASRAEAVQFGVRYLDYEVVSINSRYFITF